MWRGSDKSYHTIAVTLLWNKRPGTDRSTGAVAGGEGLRKDHTCAIGYRPALRRANYPAGFHEGGGAR